MFVVMAICAVCALIGRTSDWIAAIGFGLSAVIVMLAINLSPEAHSNQLSRGIRYVLLLLGCVIAWFSLVDHSHSFESCDHCFDHRFIGEYRICGIPVWSKYGDFHTNHVSRLRTDLGMPCQH
jgi:hypothetical protein